MCYFLYGSINDEINIKDYEKITKDSNYHFNIGSENDVNACIHNCSFEYRITSNYCDCNTPVGLYHTNKKGLNELAEVLESFKSIRGIKYITINKNWSNEPNENEETVHIDDIDIIHFLANIEEKTLYKVELYKKYY